MSNYKTVIFEIKDLVANVVLNRPEVHNAFNEVMIKELTEIFEKLSKNDSIRVVVLTGNGKSFCAGADLNWMKKVINYSYEENFDDSFKLAELFYLIYSLPKPTIAKVNGSAIGGGTGLVSVCDIVIASENAKFSLSEVKLGLVPACISPYVVRRIGESKAREFFLTGERLTAEKAQKIGLVNEVVPPEDLDKKVDEKTKQLISSGPEALKWCKELLEKIPLMNLDLASSYTAEVIAKLRISNEGQEGMNAFLEKRKPRWNKTA